MPWQHGRELPVSAGGLLITGPKWGVPPGMPATEEHPRYAARTLGKGRLAIAKADPDDPYVLASDSALLISHRYELLRFWNGGVEWFESEIALAGPQPEPLDELSGGLDILSLRK
jgi:hypothetical protein